MKPRTALIPLPGKAQILLTKYTRQPGHYSELLIRHAQDSNAFQAWPSSLDHTCFQGPEAKNNSGASQSGQQRPGGSCRPLAQLHYQQKQGMHNSTTTKTSTTGFFPSVPITSIRGLLVFFAPSRQKQVWEFRNK